MINEAVAGESLQPGKPFRHDSHMKVAAFAGAGVAGMVGAVVTDLQGRWIEFGVQPAFDFGGDHVLLSSSGGRCLPRYRPWASVNSTIRPVAPNTLKLAQVPVEKL